MAIKEACMKLWETEKTDDKSISDLIENLNKTKTIKENKDLELNKDLIKKMINHLDNTVPIKQTIEEKAQNLSGAKNIAKKLSQVDLLDQDAIKAEIKSLTSSYGKKLSKFKSLTVFTFVVRFLVPVLMVPISGKLKKKIIELTSKNKTQNQN